MQDPESPRPVMRVVLKRRDGNLEYTHVKLQDVRHVGADGIERVFEPTGETDEQGLATYREVSPDTSSVPGSPN